MNILIKLLKYIKHKFNYSLYNNHQIWDNYINITNEDFHELLYKKYDDLYYNYRFFDDSIFVFVYDNKNNCEVFNVSHYMKENKSKNINVRKLGYFNRQQNKFYYINILKKYFDLTIFNN